MKTRFLYMILAIIIMVFGCEDDDDDVNRSGEICYLSKVFDDKKGLSEDEFIYSSDNKLERRNIYDEGTLAGYYTMEYTEGKITRINEIEDNTIIRYEEISWTGNEISNIKLYGTNDDNATVLWSTYIFVYSNGKISNMSITSEFVEYEMIYTWSEGNVVKISQSLQVPNDNYNETSVTTCQYDDKKNVYNGFNSYYPHAMMHFSGISENNITLATETDENGEVTRIQTSTYTYNATGYPITVTEVDNEVGDQTETYISSLEYNCK
jgi:hypothetical protein